MAGEKVKSSLLCTGIKMTLPTGEEMLLVELQLDCPVCGQGTWRVAGHHLRSIRDAMIQMIDLHPGLTGADDDVHTIEKLKFGMRGPSDPSQN